MKFLFWLKSRLEDRINALITKSAQAEPGMPEVAAMVYVGDVYVLREQPQRRHADGWGGRRYVCHSAGCKKLP